MRKPATVSTEPHEQQCTLGQLLMSDILLRGTLTVDIRKRSFSRYERYFYRRDSYHIAVFFVQFHSIFDRRASEEMLRVRNH